MRAKLQAIPLEEPFADRNANRNLAIALERGHIHGAGVFSSKCESYINEQHASFATYLTSSGTSALELAAQTLSIEPGDEILLPAFTFVACVTAFCGYGAVPVFCDIDPMTLNICASQVRRKITGRTRVVLVVHYAGIPVDMEAIAAACDGRQIVVIEDNAHGLFGRYRGKLLGTMGALTILSFDQQKSYRCGEGGALIVNRKELLSNVEVAVNCGTNRADFDRGTQNEYVWVGAGSKRRPSELQAAVLWSQLESRRDIQAGRRVVWEFYISTLRPWALRTGVALPHVPAGCDPSFHSFYLIMPSPEARDALIHCLRMKGVGCGSHYTPLNASPGAAKYSSYLGDCPVAELIAGCIIRLPCYPSLTTFHLEYVIEAITNFFP